MRFHRIKMRYSIEPSDRIYVKKAMNFYLLHNTWANI